MSILGGIVKGSGDTAESKFEQISFHDNLLILPARMIQISNISRVSSYCIKKTWANKIFMLICTLVSLSLAMQKAGQEAWYIGVAVFGALFLYAMLFKRYGIQIQTNGNTTDHLITKNQGVADKLYSMISYYIHNLEGNKAITIDNSLNIVSGDAILGDKFSEIENSTIVNRSEVS